MPKPHTLPTFYDEVKNISITKLKGWQYLIHNSVKSGTVTWSRNGSSYASISILVNTFIEKPYIEFEYKCNGEPVKYKVYFTTLPSNLGKGKVWYFLCPNTGKRCRKLYMVSKYFLHRGAFRGAMYEKQTYSKNARGQIQLFEGLFGKEKAYEELYSKHFKKYYNGKPTKRYLKICRQINSATSISYEELIMMK